MSKIDTNKSEPELKAVKLGKNIELRYIPFSELAIPWNVCLDTTTSKQQKTGVHINKIIVFINYRSIDCLLHLRTGTVIPEKNFRIKEV